jgi:hypothetical protein
MLSPPHPSQMSIQVGFDSQELLLSNFELVSIQLFPIVIKILYDIFNLFKPNPFWLYYENVGLITWACIKDI